MGVIHKIKPEIREFILEEKKTNPILSCRSLTALVEEKFQIKLSKSSINFIIKQAGLSMPVGRRLKRRRQRTPAPVQPIVEVKPQIPTEIRVEQPPKPAVEEPAVIPAVAAQPEIHIETPSEIPCTGAILLKAADYLIAGIASLTEAVKNQLIRNKEDLIAKTESLIYASLFDNEQSGLWALVGKRFSPEDIQAYLNELQEVRTIELVIQHIITNVLQEVRYIKVNTLDGNIFYLDGQMYTVWSTPHIPFDFSSTICNTKSYINKYFYKDKPLMLCMAPGYDTPTKDFFNFLLSFDSKEKDVARLTLYGNKLEELEVISLRQGKRRFFIFGLWPWQFADYRKVNNLGEFKPYEFAGLKKEFYTAEIEVRLSEPIENQVVTLRGCALKTSLNEKTRLIILTNLPYKDATAEELMNTYFNHWPNLEETFQDFSRKIELFTYTADSQRFFSTESLNLTNQSKQDVTSLFNNYLKALDLYVKWHFLPSGYENKDFSTIKAQFYQLKAILNQQKEHTLVTFQPPQQYPLLKELEYACRRINEREIFLPDAKRLWLSISA